MPKDAEGVNGLAMPRLSLVTHHMQALVLMPKRAEAQQG